MSSRTPTPSSTRGCACWRRPPPTRRDTRAIPSWWAMMTSRSTACAAHARRICSSSAATTPARSCSVWSRTTAPPARSWKPPTGSSRTTPTASARNCGPTARAASRSTSTPPSTSATRRSSSRTASATASRSGGLRREVAILYRSNAQSRVLEEAFLSARMPYRVYGGLRFFERAEIKDALAYLRLMSNRNDDASFERVVNLPTRGIGAKSLDMLRDYARRARGLAVAGGGRLDRRQRARAQGRGRDPRLHGPDRAPGARERRTRRCTSRWTTCSRPAA